MMRDNTGRIVPRYCPNPMCSGELVPDRPDYYGQVKIICNGLVDPGDESKELEACEHTHPEYLWQEQESSNDG